MLRTFSKIYGLAGLRVGYAVSAPEVCAAMAADVLPGFDVAISAQVAAIASVGDEAELARRRAGERRRDHAGSRLSCPIKP